jgi:hypothetical protein
MTITANNLTAAVTHYKFSSVTPEEPLPLEGVYLTKNGETYEYRSCWEHMVEVLVKICNWLCCNKDHKVAAICNVYENKVKSYKTDNDKKELQFVIALIHANEKDFKSYASPEMQEQVAEVEEQLNRPGQGLKITEGGNGELNSSTSDSGDPPQTPFTSVPDSSPPLVQQPATPSNANKELVAEDLDRKNKQMELNALIDEKEDQDIKQALRVLVLYNKRNKNELISVATLKNYQTKLKENFVYIKQQTASVQEMLNKKMNDWINMGYLCNAKALQSYQCQEEVLKRCWPTSKICPA